eukprot:6831263-Prymnesium_polylepis.1
MAVRVVGCFLRSYACCSTAVSLTGGGLGLPGTSKSIVALQLALSRLALTTQLSLLPLGTIVSAPSLM